MSPHSLKAIAAILLINVSGYAATESAAVVKSSASPREIVFNASLADIVEGLMPAVVNISTTATVSPNQQRIIPLPRLPFGIPLLPFDEMPELGEGFAEKLKRSSLGSGFIVDSEGYIVTNYHVIADADKVLVRLSDDAELEAKTVGVDKSTDIALLKVEAGRKLECVSFGDSGTIRVGDRIFVIGNPYGLGGSVTSGIVSYKARDIGGEDMPSRSQSRLSDYVHDLIQIDASVNQGNSGGPVFNLKGEVIGMSTVIFSPTGTSIGLAFAIPSRVIQDSVAQLKKFGKARHGWIGVNIQPVTEEIADSLGLRKAAGALVASVVPDGPAAKVGLRTGDVILKFNGHDIKDSRRVPRLVGEIVAEKKVPVVIWRDRKEVTIHITIGEFEAAEESGLIPGSGGEPRAQERGREILGMELQTLTRDSRERYEIKQSAKGVLIAGLKRDSQPWSKNVRPGDTIVEVDQQPVETPAQVIEKIEAAKKSNRKTVLLLISHGDDDVMFVALRLDGAKDVKPSESAR
jgi:serine protease Do